MRRRVVRGNAEAFVHIRPWHHFDVLDRGDASGRVSVGLCVFQYSITVVFIILAYLPLAWIRLSLPSASLLHLGQDKWI